MKLTWLHLSDLHMCQLRTGWESRRILETLLLDIKKLGKEQGLKPDLVFITGDCAYGELEEVPIFEQYNEVGHFLLHLIGEDGLNLRPERLFIVPGNHDVNRSEVTEDQAYWLREQRDPNIISEMLRSKSKQWQRYMERLNAFRDFLNGFGFSHLLQDPSSLTYSAKLRINDIDIGIAGINTAWSCWTDKEKGQLWSGGKWQIETALANIKESQVKICIMHHPPEWLVEHESGVVDKLLERSFNFMLHGHDHSAWVALRGKEHVRIAGGSCYDRADKENGYNLTTLDIEMHKCSIWLRKFDAEGSGWVSRPVSEVAELGVWTIDNLEGISSSKQDRGKCANGLVLQGKVDFTPKSRQLSDPF